MSVRSGPENDYERLDASLPLGLGHSSPRTATATRQPRGLLEEDVIISNATAALVEPRADRRTSGNCRKTRLCKMVLVCLAPIPLAVAPVAMPFGDPYAQSRSADCLDPLVSMNRTNGTWCVHAPMDVKVFQRIFIENWAYFLWYTPVGWAQLWLATTYWSSDCLRHLNHPIDVEHPYRVVVCATLFTCVIYTLGAFIVFPFPIGTFSLGLPSFGCFFAFLVRGSTSRALEAEPTRFCRCLNLTNFQASLLAICMYWSAWIFMLFFLVVLKFLLLTTHDSAISAILKTIGFMVGPYLARNAARIASNSLLETSNEFFGGHSSFNLWWVYSVAIFKNFILSGNGNLGAAKDLVRVQVLQFMITRLRVCGIVNASLRHANDDAKDTGTLWQMFCHLLRFQKPPQTDEARDTNVPYHWRKLWSTTKVKDQTEDLLEEGLSEMLAPLHFAAVVLFNCFGPNNGAFYFLDTLGPAEARQVAAILAANSLFKALSLAITVYELRSELQYQPEKSDPETADRYRAALEDVRKQLVTRYDLWSFRFRRHTGSSRQRSSSLSRHISHNVFDVLQDKFSEDTVNDDNFIDYHVEQLARHESASEFLDRVVWLWVDRDWMALILLFAANVTIVGSCMVMKHDGMDFSFEFEWLPASVANTSNRIVDAFIVTLFVLWCAGFLCMWLKTKS